MFIITHISPIGPLTVIANDSTKLSIEHRHEQQERIQELFSPVSVRINMRVMLHWTLSHLAFLIIGIAELHQL